MTTPKFAIDFVKIRANLVNTVAKYTGVQVIEEEPEAPDAPRPNKPYISLKITSPALKQGDDSTRNVTDSDGNLTTQVVRGGQRQMNVQFDAYGNSHEEAYNYMALIQSSLELETMQADLRVAGIAVWLNGNVVDMSALLNTGYEGRAMMEVQFGIAANTIEDVGAIDTAQTSGTITTDTGQQITMTPTGDLGDLRLPDGTLIVTEKGQPII